MLIENLRYLGYLNLSSEVMLFTKNGGNLVFNGSYQCCTGSIEKKSIFGMRCYCRVSLRIHCFYGQTDDIQELFNCNVHNFKLLSLNRKCSLFNAQRAKRKKITP